MRGWWRQLPLSGNPSGLCHYLILGREIAGSLRTFLPGRCQPLSVAARNLQRRALSPASSCGDVPFPSVAMLGLAERDRLSSGNRNHGGQSLPDGGPFGRRHSLHRTVSAGDDRHGTFSSASRYSVFLFSAGRYGVDVEVAFYLPVDASRGTDTCYHCPGHTCSGRTGTGNIAGANVVMPNLSPSHQRAKYSLYDNKASAGAERQKVC